MIDSYHLAIERLTGIDAPVVCRGARWRRWRWIGLTVCRRHRPCGRRDAQFALGYGALGLTADGGNTWFLPRMVGTCGARKSSSC